MGASMVQTAASRFKLGSRNIPMKKKLPRTQRGSLQIDKTANYAEGQEEAGELPDGPVWQSQPGVNHMVEKEGIRDFQLDVKNRTMTFDFLKDDNPETIQLRITTTANGLTLADEERAQGPEDDLTHTVADTKHISSAD